MTGIKDVARDAGDVHRDRLAGPARAARASPTRPGSGSRSRPGGSATCPSPSAAGLASGQTRTVAVDRPAGDPVVLRRGRPGRRGGAARARLRPAPLQPRRRSAAARHRVFETSLLTKRVDAVLVLSLQPSADELDPARAARTGRSPSSAPTCRAGPRSASTTSRPPRTATEHLIELGHRRIGYVGGATEASSTSPLPTPGRPATARPCVAAGLPHDAEPRGRRGVHRWPAGPTRGRQLLARADRPTAIFAASDEMAIGVLRAARELDLRVPEDVSVIGIDDHELAAFFDLTTVAQPVLRAGPGGGPAGARRARRLDDRGGLAPRPGDPADHRCCSAAAPVHRRRA